MKQERCECHSCAQSRRHPLEREMEKVDKLGEANNRIAELEGKVQELAQLCAPAGQGDAVKAIDEIIMENERLRQEVKALDKLKKGE